MTPLPREGDIRKQKEEVILERGYSQQPVRPFSAQFKKNAVGAPCERKYKGHKDRGEGDLPPGCSGGEKDDDVEGDLKDHEGEGIAEKGADWLCSVNGEEGKEPVPETAVGPAGQKIDGNCRQTCL